MAREERIDLDAGPEPKAATPGSIGGEIGRWAPIIKKLADAIRGAVAGGALVIPVIKVRIFGRQIDLGPIPIRVLPETG